MAKKQVSVCDKCEDAFATVSLSVRMATSNMSLKLVPKIEAAGDTGPIDLCDKCFKEVMKGVKWPKDDKESPGV